VKGRNKERHKGGRKEGRKKGGERRREWRKYISGKKGRFESEFSVTLIKEKIEKPFTKTQYKKLGPMHFVN
jgi:hypothetical protein